MKSTVIMIRPMNGIDIRQDSKTRFFNANDLVQAYNLNKGEKKRIQDYLDNEATKRYMSALLQSELDINAEKRNLETTVIMTRRGRNGGSWMHPFLFLDFAMWLNPEFKVTVIKWLYDNLIALRIDAGDGFKEVNEAIFNRNPNSLPHIYSNEAKMINKLVFGSPDRGQRNNATEEQLALLKLLQKVDIKLINEGSDLSNRYEKLKEFKKYL